MPKGFLASVRGVFDKVVTHLWGGFVVSFKWLLMLQGFEQPQVCV